ncbi:MAG: hypothetical protein KF691_15975 [Phycisphaeraceae bacterium]|nr:hypothetical protein [Phycisphaeraceae bacterium]
MARNCSLFVGAAIVAALSTTGSANAGTIWDTGSPEGGFFGYTGYDVFVGQSVAVAFTVTQSYSLDRVGVWMMSNDWENAGRTYTLSIRTDANGGATSPSNSVLESWNMATGATGWNPVLDQANSVLHPILEAGKTYWIVAESTEEPFVDPVWVWANYWDGALSGNIDWVSNPGVWQTGVTYGSTPGTVIEGTLIPGVGTLSLAGMAGLLAARRRR